MLKKLNCKLLFLLLSCIILIWLIIFNHFYFKHRYLHDNQISTEEINIIMENRMEYEDKISLYYDKKEIPYSNDSSFYLLHINDENDYKKIYTTSDFELDIINIVDNYIINLFLYNDNYYKFLTLELTNLPVMDITTDNELNLYGFDKIESLKAIYSLRGDSSKYSDKPSYNLKLYNMKNKKISLPLLGMKSNDTWILNPMYFDNSYMREKLSYDIWNSLSDDFKHTLEYIELFIDGEYLGLYCLQEKVDINTFDGSLTNDLLMSVNSWGSGEEDESNDLDKIISRFEIEGGLENNYSKQKKILKKFASAMINNTTDMSFVYDINNISNYSVFLNLTLSLDNIYKNQKILFRNMGNYYLLQKTVWDLDWSFYNRNVNKVFVDSNLNINDIIYDMTIPTVVVENSLLLKIMKLKYFTFRDKLYNEEKMFSLINKYTNYLEEYGAVNRDISKWHNDLYHSDIIQIKDYIIERINILDEYYGGL